MQPQLLHTERQPRQKILILDDETNILNALQRILRQESFDVITTASPYEALHLATQERFAALVCDYKMPFMNGIEVMEKFCELSPNTVRILLTAYADMQVAVDAINRGSVYKLMMKPWKDEELQCVMRQAVSQAKLAYETRPIVESETTMPQQLEEESLPESDDPESKLIINPQVDKQALIKKIFEQYSQIYQLNRDLEKSHMASIRAMARMAELHNKLIWRHAQRVYVLCRTMAPMTNIPLKQRTQLEIAALLHDMGKIGIPGSILKKPEAELDETELALIKSHTIQGQVLINMIPGFEDAAKMICHHHEHFDGSGYPDKLSGEDIPLGARLIAIADTYDNALYGNRLARKVSVDEALAVVQEDSGTLFDPALIPLLASCAHELSSVSPEQIAKKEPYLQWTDLFDKFQKEASMFSSNVVDFRSKNRTEQAGEAPDEASEAAPPPEPEIAAKNQNKPFGKSSLTSPAGLEDSTPGFASDSEKSSKTLRSDDQLTNTAAQQGINRPVTRRNPYWERSGEVEIFLRDLSVGMVLAQDFYSSKRVKLLPKGTVITQNYLMQLQKHIQNSSPLAKIMVYKDKYVPPKR